MTRETVPVSVIIPVLDGSALIGETLASIARQSWMPAEVFVVDGGSTHDSATVVQAFAQQPGVPPTRYMTHADPGAASKRNCAAAMATGDYLAFLDADDLWPDDRTEVLLGALLGDHALDCATGAMQQFRADGSRSGEFIYLGSPVATRLPSAALIRRKSFERIGEFDARLRVGETIEWWSRAMDAGFRCVPVEATVLLRRVHAGNLGKRRPDPGRDYLDMLRGVLERRRGDS